MNIPLTIVLLLGPYCVSPDYALKMYLSSASTFQQTQVNLDLRRLVVTQDPCSGKEGLGNFPRKIKCLFRYSKRHFKSKHTSYHLIVPPIWEGTVPYISTAASSYCRGKKFFSLSNAMGGFSLSLDNFVASTKFMNYGIGMGINECRKQRK